jgi:hypothetical protein
MDVGYKGFILYTVSANYIQLGYENKGAILMEGQNFLETLRDL